MAERQQQSPPAAALAGVLRSGRSGVLGKEAQVRLQHLQPGAMVQINGATDGDTLHSALHSSEFAQDLSPQQCPTPLQSVTGGQLRLLWNGPGRYLAVCDAMKPEALLSALTDALRARDMSCVDVSHASCVLRVQGPCAHEVIAKGCALDLELMRPRSCTPTAIARFEVLLHCVGDDAFEVFVARSLAASFAQWLLRASAEFGVSVYA